MNCPEFQDMNPKERAEYIGELIHSAMSDSKFFELGQKIIRSAKRKGLFDGVKIQPTGWSNVPPDDPEKEIINPVS